MQENRDEKRFGRNGLGCLLGLLERSSNLRIFHMFLIDCPERIGLTMWQPKKGWIRA